MGSRNRWTFVIALMAAPLIAPSAGHADFALEFSSGGSTLIVNDNGVGDTNPTLGAIGVSSGTVVGNYTINNAGGTGFPLTGSATNPSIDVSSLDVTNTGSPGTLTVLLSETGFTSPLGSISFSGAIGGTEQTQTVAYSDFFNANNALFGTNTQIGSTLTFTNPSPGSSNPSFPFSGSVSGAGNTTNPYSLTEQILITGTASAEVVSFDASLTGRPVPEPASLILFGTALTGLGLLARRRRSV